MILSSSVPALSLADLEAFDPQGSERAGEKVYRCPICQSDERALHVNHETGLWNCKRASCGAAGKLTDFWSERPKLRRQEYSRLALRRAFALESPQPKSEPATAATGTRRDGHRINRARIGAAIIQAQREYSSAANHCL
jgi:ribosomal protein L37AE/L43A